MDMTGRNIIKVAAWAMGILLLVVLVIWWWNSDPERRWRCFANQQAPCSNCQSFLVSALEQFAMDHDNCLPSGGSSPLNSLLQVTNYLGGRLHFFTSHGLAGRLQTSFDENGTLNPEFCCFRYNEGLSLDDRNTNLIVLYYYKPTRWYAWDSKWGYVGRRVADTSLSPGWDFVSEDEFQRRQAFTRDYIEKKNLRMDDLRNITAALLLEAHSRSKGSNVFHLTATLVNTGKEAITVQFVDEGALVGKSLIELKPFKKKPELRLAPGETYIFPGWTRIGFDDTMIDGKISKRIRVDKGAFQDELGRSFWSYGQPEDPAIVNSQEFAQAVIRVRAWTDTIKECELVIRSRRLQYMTNDVIAGSSPAVLNQ